MWFTALYLYICSSGIHSEDKSTSVFSRLDHSDHMTTQTQPTRVTVDTTKPRTIKLSKQTKQGSIQVTARPRPDRYSEVSSTRNPTLHSDSAKGRLGKRTGTSSRPKSMVGGVSSRMVGGVSSRPRSMVADEVDYQTVRHTDVRSRLNSKEREKVARRRGPLAGRLEKHHVFGRLE